MTATQSASLDATIAFSEQDQAAALWTYVHLKIPRFTTDAALEVVRRLAPRTDEDPKALAKRLRKELELRGVALKNTTALDAAARLLGHNSWHAANRLPQKAKLKLTSIGESGEEFFSKWRDVIPRLCASCDTWLQSRETRIFQVRFGPTYMMLSVPVHVENDSAGRVESSPLLTINPVAEDATWLEEAPAALESLRRHLEEPGKAVLDGIAVLQLCGASRGSSRATLPQSVRPNDVCNSELILERADNELGQGYEIARGDEMTCWSQLELASKDHEDTVLRVKYWRVSDQRVCRT